MVVKIFKCFHSKPLLLVFIHVIVICFLIATVTLAFQQNVSLAYMTRDPSVTMGAEPYIGIVSNIGILFWCVTAVICLFSAAILVRYKSQRTATIYLLCSGGISLLFLFDDLLMIHEAVIPNLLGISEKGVFLGYGGILFAYFVTFWRLIFATNPLFLGLALGFFGLSIMIDVLDLPGDVIYMLEDSAKFTGIVNWCVYYTSAALTAVRRALAPAPNEQVDYQPVFH
jgi:hypothetical protein